MAHESFEDAETARLMNEFFVNIKVDREERPDLDSIYMSAVVAMTGQGGWPMSVFLTPKGEPFYGGTYFPPNPRYGMPAFREVLTALAKVWREERSEALRVSSQMAADLRKAIPLQSAQAPQFSPADLASAAQKLVATYDAQHGGWGEAPRFPAPMTIEFLLQQGQRGEIAALATATHLLKVMQRGGLMDLVGGGFHRYSTDNDWLVPHFEKMLYDNAQLASVYLHAYLLTGETSFRETCESVLDFLLREMTHPDGGFYSSLDADSEGEEGMFYVWAPNAIDQALPDPADRAFFRQVYPNLEHGNFEGKTILQKPLDLTALAAHLNLPLASLDECLADCHRQLFAARNQRVRPHTDDKILTAWNALALRVFAEAAAALDRADYLAAARKNADFLTSQLYPRDMLLRSWRAGQAHLPAYLEDYAALILALLALYPVDPNPRWFAWAERLTNEMRSEFTDPAGGFFDTRVTRAGEPELIVRPKDLQDNATPSGNALAVQCLLRLAQFTGETAMQSQAETVLGALQPSALKYPSAFSCWLQALDFAVGPVQQVAVIWPAGSAAPSEFLGPLAHAYRPRTIIATASYPLTVAFPALLAERTPLNGLPTVYICRGFICQLPLTRPEDLTAQLDEAPLTNPISSRLNAAT